MVDDLDHYVCLITSKCQNAPNVRKICPFGVGSRASERSDFERLTSTFFSSIILHLSSTMETLKMHHHIYACKICLFEVGSRAWERSDIERLTSTFLSSNHSPPVLTRSRPNIINTTTKLEQDLSTWRLRVSALQHLRPFVSVNVTVLPSINHSPTCSKQGTQLGRPPHTSVLQSGDQRPDLISYQATDAPISRGNPGR